MSRPGRVLLVTGTDTGVGKTVVACGLARALAARGRRVVALKPVESGCPETLSEEEDGVRLALAARQAEPPAALVRLRAPVAPPLAADREGTALDARTWIEATRELAAGHEFTLLEGAGGLLSPLTWETTALDLARELSAAALVVAPDRLGCLNHTLLTLRALEDEGVPVVGVVLSAPETADMSTGTNAASLRRVAPDVRVAELRRLRDPEEAAAALDPVLEWLGE